LLLAGETEVCGRQLSPTQADSRLLMITNATQSTETNSQAQSISSHNNTSYLFTFGFFDVCSIFSPTFLACFFFFFFCLFLFDFVIIIHLPSLHQQSTTHRDQISSPSYTNSIFIPYIIYITLSVVERTLLETITLQRGTTWTARVPNCNHATCGPNGTVLFPCSHPTTRQRRLEKRRGRERKRSA